MGLAGMAAGLAVPVGLTIDGATVLVNQAAQALKDAPGDASDGTQTGNRVMIEGPNANLVPEPMTFSMMGIGLVGLGLYVWYLLILMQVRNVVDRHMTRR